jgi:hypothetical protein
MLYTSSSPSLAMLEFICNASGIAKTTQTCLLTIKINGNVKVEELKVNDLPENWQNVPAPDSIRNIGDRWLQSKISLILKKIFILTYFNRI